jgi:RimJ/RimL family protein N-acetyltransferase
VQAGNLFFNKIVIFVEIPKTRIAMIRLAPFTREDFDQLISWIPDEQTMMNWSGNLFRFPLSVDSLEWYLRDTNVVNDSDAFVYKAVNGSGVSVGHISLGGISWTNRSARISRVLIGDRDQRGSGYCQGMIRAVLKIAFEELKLHRVGLGVYMNNPAASKCYQKNGFMIEGIQRDILWHNSSWWSMIEMSILEKEWQELQTTGVGLAGVSE